VRVTRTGGILRAKTDLLRKPNRHTRFRNLSTKDLLRRNVRRLVVLARHPSRLIPSGLLRQLIFNLLCLIFGFWVRRKTFYTRVNNMKDATP